MVIQYYGVDFVRLAVGDLTLAFNPVGKDHPAKTTRFGSDLALVSTNDEAHNGIETVTGSAKTPFVIDGPGEYEWGGIFIEGYPTASVAGENLNTAYRLVLDGLTVVHLGAISAAPEGDVAEALGGADVLFVPVTGTLTPAAAAKLAAALEPRMIVSVGWGGVKDGEAALKTFLKESGAANTAEVEKLALKKKDVEGLEAAVSLIKSF